MRASSFFFKTLREAPSYAETESYRLLLRAGFVDPVGAGIFNYMPLGWRSIQKIRLILTQEMEAAGAHEVNMPVVQPRSIWEKSGRAESFVPPLASFQDRHGRTMVLAPTHEETAVLMAESVVSSYRDMPALIYHIQTKFRDEPRPRSGLLRVREFEMKDAYSFDIDEEGLDESFQNMRKAYKRIFKRCGLDVMEIEADSGSIGGKTSSEFVLPTETGDDIVLFCPECGYAANSEKASFRKEPLPAEPEADMEAFNTPGILTIAALAAQENVPESKTAKVVFFFMDGSLGMAVIRGDYQVSETKLRNALGGSDVRMAKLEEVETTKLISGSASPIGLEDKMKIVVDDSLRTASNLLAGANKKDLHMRNVNFPRDFRAHIVIDIAEAQEGSICPNCPGLLQTKRCIEIGHIFKLGDSYSKTMNFLIQNADGQEKAPLMGCYGIGLGRLLAAAVEANRDELGIRLPVSIAPFEVVILNLGTTSPELYKVAESLYKTLLDNGVDAFFEDREISPGVKLTDADLIGFPVRTVISSRSIKQGGVEIKLRNSQESFVCAVDRAAQEIIKALR